MSISGGELQNRRKRKNKSLIDCSELGIHIFRTLCPTQWGVLTPLQIFAVGLYLYRSLTTIKACDAGLTHMTWWSRAKANGLCNVCILVPGCILPFLHYDTIYGLHLSCLWLLAFRIKWHELWICNQIFCAQAHTNEHAQKQTLHTLKQVPYPRGKVVNITQRSRNHNKDPGNKMWYFRVSLSLSVSIHPACMELPANLADTMPPFRGMTSAIYLWSHSTNCGDGKVVSAGAFNA